MYRHLFWDMGGTMFDTYPQVDAMLAGVVRAHGFVISERDVARLTRRSTRTAIVELAARFRIRPEEFRRAEILLKERWRTNPPPVMSGLEALMQAVREQPHQGLNLVVTHRDRCSALNLLRAQKIAVDDLICPGDGFPRKPDPQMYLELIQRHDLDPDACLSVGDRPLDVQAAQRAGIAAAMLSTPGLRLEVGSAQYVISDLSELLPVVG